MRTGRREPVVVESFHRGLDVFRPLAALYAVWLAWQRHETMVRPWVAVVVLGVMLAWSIGLLFYRRRSVGVVVIEVSIAVAGILATLLAETPEAIAAGQFTLPTIWAAGSVAGGAVVAGARGGLIAAAVIAVADLIEVGTPTQTTIHNIVLLVLLGGLIGLAVDLARRGSRVRSRCCSSASGSTSASGSPGSCTTGCSSRWPTSTVAARTSAGRRPSWPRSPPSRSARCAGSCRGRALPTRPPRRTCAGARGPRSIFASC